MAKFKPGPLAASISGSVGGTTFAHNRGGAYMRLRSVPSNPSTVYQQNIRSFLANISQGWRSLTAAQQLAWSNWAQQNPITDVIGEAIHLSGHQAYVKLNHRLAQAGNNLISTPPITAPPTPLLTLAVTGDASDSEVALAFTATPLAAGIKIFCWACVTNSPGISFVKNRLRLVKISAAAQASPLDIGADVEARFGDLIEDQKVHVLVAPFDSATGLIATPLAATCIVAA